MHSYNFTPQYPLGGYQKEFKGISVGEVTDRAVISIATPLGGGAALADTASKTYGIAIPAMGNSSISKESNARLLAVQRDQLFLLLEDAGPDAVGNAQKKLGDCAYLTDQSDSWALLGISGLKAREALARICPLNLHSRAFPEGRVQRTLMAHLGVIILRDGPDSFLLLSPVSSAKSFLHAVETSVNNIDMSQNIP